MNQIGCVLVFKPGVDPNEVVRKLRALADVVDPSYFVPSTDKNAVVAGDGTTVTRLHKFNPDHGGPVWYVP
jgi:hypothetical protein